MRVFFIRFEVCITAEVKVESVEGKNLWDALMKLTNKYGQVFFLSHVETTGGAHAVQ